MKTGWRDLSLAGVALAAFAAFVLIGYAVGAHGPAEIDLAARALRGHSLGAALAFTSLGFGPWLIAVTLAAGALLLAYRLPIVPLAVVFGSQLASQAVVSVVKLGFHRARPLQPLGLHLPDYSYPSGHAVTAVVFYAALALLFARSALPRPVAAIASGLASICVVAIPWSRLALGAHWATDVAGGLCFGAGWIFALQAIAEYVKARRERVGNR